MFGATPAVALAQELEKLAVAGTSMQNGLRTASLARMADKLAQLQAEIEHLLTALHQRSTVALGGGDTLS
jgi:ferredoxin-NADP reductase